MVRPSPRGCPAGGGAAAPPTRQQAGNVGEEEGRPHRFLATGRFYVQIERCTGLSERLLSVHVDGEKYARCADELRQGIFDYFDGELPVEIWEVHTPYAMEVRVLAEEKHPRDGQCISLEKAATSPGCRTVFSKLATKKWPKPETIIRRIRDFCKVPVRLQLLAADSLAEAAGDGAPTSWPMQVRAAVNTGYS